MTTQEIAARFYELVQAGDFETIYNELFSPDAKSIEPASGMLPSVEGMEAIREKGKKWHEMVEAMHGAYTNAPIVAGNHFACAMGMDITLKGSPRHQLDEIAVYTVQDGKIISEQFFY